MNRRAFIKSSVAAAVVGPTIRVTKAEPADNKFILSAPLTHSDWMLKPGIALGPEGVHHMLDACKACGWTRVYWRVFDGGRGLYKSKYLKPMGKWDVDSFWSPQSPADQTLVERYTHMNAEQRRALMAKFDVLDYAHFDPLAEAVRYGHKIGLKIHAWLSINEDDHGWGLQSEFSKQHPQFRWQHRDGRPYYSQLSFAFPEVRKYKLSLVRELIENYKLDGFFLDWIRTGDVRDNPQNDKTGAADYGFEAPLRDAYRKQTGKELRDATNDAAFRFRAAPQTLFMREVSKLLRKHHLPISVMVSHPWHYRGELDKIDGNLRGMLLDVSTWANEGLMDSAVAAGYYRDGGDAAKAHRALTDETASKVDVWLYQWVPKSVGEFNDQLALANKVQASQILFWEADYIEGAAKDLTQTMAAHSKP
ncbi:MAG: family 10 glycosylhydrolase [Limisphaerales bacterium]